MPWQVYMVPQFIMMRKMGLNDKLLAMICLQAFSAFGVFMMRQFYDGIPNELCEAARVDGMSEYKIYSHIMLPLSKPAIASLCLFFAVDMWNDFFRPMSYIMSEENYTLQLYLRSILVNVNDVQNTIDPLVNGLIAPQSIQNATIIVSIIPILILYPFL